MSLLMRATRPLFRPLVIAAVLVALSAVVSAWPMSEDARADQAPPKAGAKPISAGDGTIYLGTYAGEILIIDEATEKLVGKIPVSVGIPGDVTFSDDRKRIYIVDASFEKIEILDREKRATIDTFTLSKERTRTRIWSLQPDPHDKYLILLIKNYTLHPDRWEVGPPTLVQVDLATKAITRTIPWPKGEERDGVGVLFSPDGKLMYLMGEDVLIYDTEKFVEVDRWELARPLEPGAGRVSFGGLDPFSDEPGFFTGLFTMQDPVQNRRIMGIGRIDLARKKIDFQPVGPARGLSFTVSPDRKRGYGLFSDIGDYAFWTFDLETHRVVSRVPFRGRPRMGIRVSSNGKIVYVHTAGNTIDLHDAETMTKLRTITLDGDMTMGSFTVLSARTAPRR